MKNILKTAFLPAFFWSFTGICFCSDVYTLEYSGNRNTLFHNGKVLTFADCVEKQLSRYPDASARSMAKFAYHAAFGSGKTPFDRKKFSDEFASVQAKNMPLFEIISPDYCRINLAAWKYHKLPEEWLARICEASAEIFPDSKTLYSAYLQIIAGKVPGFSAELQKLSDRIPEHSPGYQTVSYRVVSTRFLQVIPVLRRLAVFPENTTCVIAVDGRAASGKTTFSRQLAYITGGGVIHMDDFFLPVDMRTAERLNQPGGNVHYERFKKEVIPHLKYADAFSYQRFDCSKMSPGDMINVSASRWRIVEGAYCFHPVFGNYADLKIFFDITPETQLKRIRKRNGERAAQMFTSRWIPLEEKYIKAYGIKAQADVIIGGHD